MAKSRDHRPPGWIGQSRKCCTQSIHNHMVVDFHDPSSVNFGGRPAEANVQLARGLDDGSQVLANEARSRLFVVHSHHAPPSAGFIDRNGGCSRK